MGVTAIDSPHRHAPHHLHHLDKVDKLGKYSQPEVHGGTRSCKATSTNSCCPSCHSHKEWQGSPRVQKNICVSLGILREKLSRLCQGPWHCRFFPFFHFQVSIVNHPCNIFHLRVHYASLSKSVDPWPQIIYVLQLSVGRNNRETQKHGKWATIVNACRFRT